MRKPRKQRNRKQQHTKRAGRGRGKDALTAAAVIAAGTQAYGAPVRYDAPPGGLEFGDGIRLDVRLPADEQAGAPAAASSFMHAFEYQPMTYEYGYPYYYPIPGFARSTLAGSIGGETGTAYGYVDPVDGGELIGTGALEFNSPALLFYDWIYYTHYDFSTIQPGDRAYIGVRFDPGDGDHFGWIEVDRQGWDGYDLHVHAWGYETTPGQPIPAGAVPEPGSLALLAFGFAAAVRRRR